MGQRRFGLDEKEVTGARHGRWKHADLWAAEEVAALVVGNASMVEFLGHEVGVEENAGSVHNDV
jgi:hypothetical protein